MKKDRRSLYVWFFAILANFGMYAWVSRDAAFPSTGISWFIGVSLFIFIIPTWLSASRLKIRDLLGYGLPVIVIIYSIGHYLTCTGKFCEILDIPISIGALISGTLYFLGVYLRRWNVRVVLSLLCIEAVLLVVIYTL